jgi:hypothetical protein
LPAIYRIGEATIGLSALALKRGLGVRYPIAWLIHHKLIQAMVEREVVKMLRGNARVDDADLGGERIGGIAGWGLENKVPFIGAVSFNDQGRPLRAQLTPLSGFTRTAVAARAGANLAPTGTVTSDGLASFACITDIGCTHRPTVVGAHTPEDLPMLDQDRPRQSQDRLQRGLQ